MKTTITERLSLEEAIEQGYKYAIDSTDGESVVKLSALANQLNDEELTRGELKYFEILDHRNHTYFQLIAEEVIDHIKDYILNNTDFDSDILDKACDTLEESSLSQWVGQQNQTWKSAEVKAMNFTGIHLQ